MSIIDELLNFIQQHPRLLVITGAGCSQPSGIPTYRDEEGAWQRSTPIQHKEFMEKESVREKILGAKLQWLAIDSWCDTE